MYKSLFYTYVHNFIAWLDKEVSVMPGEEYHLYEPTGVSLCFQGILVINKNLKLSNP